MNKLIHFIIMMTIFSSCCTEKLCDEDIFPQIVITYEGFSDLELQNKIVYILEKETFEIIDSIEFNFPQNQFVIDKWLMNDIFGEKREIKNYSYLLKLKSRQDTIGGINYERTIEKIDCNNCFPFGDGSASITDFKNLEYLLNKNIYQNIDTVLINK